MVGRLPKRIFENTVPCTNDFLDPQNCSVMRSSMEKPRRFAIHPTLKNTRLHPTPIKKLPQLQEINKFYQETDIELKAACAILVSATIINNDYHVKKRLFCQEFKSRRKLFFNNFVSVVSSFDIDMALEIENLINELDDSYVEAIDCAHTQAILDKSIMEIYINRASVYRALFSKFS